MRVSLYTKHMRVVLQKVTKASVGVDHEVVGSIERGYLLFVCIMKDDEQATCEEMAQKVLNLRLFEGDDGKINDKNLQHIGGSILVISQFTLAGKTQKGNRPDYSEAAPADTARTLYELFIQILKNTGVTVQSGRFGAHMNVESINDGPVTLILDS